MSRIALIPGDGVGPELTRELRKVLDVVNTHFKHNISYEQFPWGGRHFIKHSESLGPEFLTDLRQNYRGVFIGALGDPTVYSQGYVHDILSGIIHGLGMTIVEKPIFLFSRELSPLKLSQGRNIRLTLIRDSIEGLQAAGGQRSAGKPDSSMALDTMLYDEAGIAGVVDHAVKRAAEEKVQMVPLIVRRALFPNTHRLWEKVYQGRMQEQGLTGKVIELPAFLKSFLEDPGIYPILLAPGAVGELLSELLSEFIGGRSYTCSLFQSPSGKFMILPDSGPQNSLAGTGRVIPQSAFLSLALIFSLEGMVTAARIMYYAIMRSFENKWLPPGSGGSMSTESIGDFIASYIDEQLSSHGE